MPISAWTETKRELYLCWQIQENILQANRTMTIASQSILLAATAVFFNLAREEFINLAGAGRCWFSGGAPCPKTLLPYFTIVGVILVFSVLSFYILREMHRNIRQRERLVTMCQNLLIREEAGHLEEELSQFTINGLVPLFSALKIAGHHNISPKLPCSNILPEGAAWQYFKDRFESNDRVWDFPQEAGRLRRAFTRFIFVFYVFWAAMIISAIVFLVYLF